MFEWNKKEMPQIIGEVAEIALKAAEEKGLTFREVMYLPEAIDARIKDEIKKRNEPFLSLGITSNSVERSGENDT